jgi:PAS domain S-box-containing protein
VTLRSLHGRQVPVLLSGSKVTDETGRLKCVVLTARDISDRLRSRAQTLRMVQDIERRETQLRAANKFHQKLLATAATAIVTVDHNHHITSVNDTFREITGYEADEMVGRSCSVLRGDACKQGCALFAAQQTGQIRKLQCTIRTRDGRRITILKNADVIQDDDGTVIGGIESFVDVTELVAAREAAEEANRAKSEFLAKMSHEIRTPMNGVIGMTDLALETELTAEQRDYLAMARNSADALLDVINDILDFSKIEAGRMALENIPFDPRAVVEDVLGTFGVHADEKGLELTGYVAPETPAQVAGDPGRLRQILINLVGNAIKFTPAGSVCVDVRPRLVQAELCFSVRDSGIGISEQKRQMIFDAFEQADGSTTRKYGGTGLGLAISAQLAAMMGGRIWVESRLGEGSTFHFNVRVGVTGDDAGPRQEVPSPPAGAEILIVDDHPDGRALLQRMLDRRELRVSTAVGLQPAVTALRQRRTEGQAAPLVLLDAHLAGDAFEAAMQMRDEQLASRVVMLLGSPARRAEARLCRKLDLMPYMTKPIRQDDLLRTIAECTFGPCEQYHAPDDAKMIQGEPATLRILLAEDNPVNQKLTTTILEKAGHFVTVAGDGVEAVECFKAGSFDLVLMDVQMPNMSGLDAAEAIRRLEGATSSHVPILALTAHAMKGDLDKCIEAGMDGYLSKPVRRNHLLEMISRHASPAACAIRLDPVMMMGEAGCGPDELYNRINKVLAALPHELSTVDGALDSGVAESAGNIAQLLRTIGDRRGCETAMAVKSALVAGGRSEISSARMLLKQYLMTLTAALERLLKENCLAGLDSRR